MWPFRICLLKEEDEQDTYAVGAGDDAQTQESEADMVVLETTSVAEEFFSPLSAAGSQTPGSPFALSLGPAVAPRPEEEQHSTIFHSTPAPPNVLYYWNPKAHAAGASPTNSSNLPDLSSLTNLGGTAASATPDGSGYVVKVSGVQLPDVSDNLFSDIETLLHNKGTASANTVHASSSHDIQEGDGKQLIHAANEAQASQKRLGIHAAAKLKNTFKPQLIWDEVPLDVGADSPPSPSANEDNGIHPPAEDVSSFRQSAANEDTVVRPPATPELPQLPKDAPERLQIPSMPQRPQVPAMSRIPHLHGVLLHTQPSEPQRQPLPPPPSPPAQVFPPLMAKPPSPPNIPAGRKRR
mmetsp:Transcript_16881/g.33281  ORF Transcript_16881/g.33281 Transcript_16881/m.33281 type:complete len:352 (-) Transcript_16881:633-1688(-)